VQEDIDMKKFFFLLIMLGLSLLMSINLQADTGYHSFESLELTQGELLENYTKEDYTSYYKEVDQRKFSGWRIHTVHKNIKVSYITETLFSYYNDGFTAIDYAFKLDRKVSTKVSLSATGSIGLKVSKDGKAFKNNLDSSLKLSAEYTQTSEDKESFEIKFKVDPGTQVDLYIYGEGKITNGVAARYLFWMRLDRGGFEIFLVTTQYQRLEKKQI
jgi:hypothetical protein